MWVVVFGLIVSLVVVDTATYSFPTPFLTNYLMSVGYHSGTAGIVFGCYGIGALSCVHFWGAAIHRTSDRTVVVGAMLMLSVALALPAINPENAWMFGFARYLQGVMSAGVWAAARTAAVRAVDNTRFSDGGGAARSKLRDRLGAVVSGVAPIGNGLGPVLGATMNHHWGVGRAYVVLGCIALILTLVTAMAICLSEFSSSRRSKMYAPREGISRGGLEMQDVAVLATAHSHFEELKEVGGVDETSGAETNGAMTTKGSGKGSENGVDGQGASTMCSVLWDPRVLVGLCGSLFGGIIQVCLEPVLAPHFLSTGDGVNETEAAYRTTAFFFCYFISMFVISFLLAWIIGLRCTNRSFVALSGVFVAVVSFVAIAYTPWPYITVLAAPLSYGVQVPFITGFGIMDDASRALTGRDNPKLYALYNWNAFLGFCVGPVLTGYLYLHSSFQLMCLTVAAIISLYGPVVVVAIIFSAVQKTRSLRH